MLDPAADNTGTYAFTAKDAPRRDDRGQQDPGTVPANGPNFFRFDDRAKYYIHIDNTGDGRRDVSYLFRFKTKIGNKNSFLYAVPHQSYSKLNVIQTYSITRETVRRRGKRERVRSRVVARGLPVAPPNIGPKRPRTTGPSPRAR